MKRTALVIAFLLIAGTAGAEEKRVNKTSEYIPTYSQQDYMEAINMGATLGVNVGIWCSARHPLSQDTLSAEEYLRKLQRCAKQKLDSMGYKYLRELAD